MLDGGQAVIRIVPAVGGRPAGLADAHRLAGGELHVDHLVPVGDGSYRTTELDAAHR